MNRRLFSRAGILAGLAALVAAPARADAPATPTDAKTATPHRVAIQVSSEDHKTQELALGNAHNYASYYIAKGEPYMIEIVAFGPGYQMMRDDMSMVKGQIETLQQDLGATIVFAACQNSRRGIAESMGEKPEQIPQIKGVVDAPSGIVRLAELQAQGWSYIKP